MKEIYVYFTNMDYFRVFREHPDFIPVFNYDLGEINECSANEYGKLKVPPINLKLIHDNGLNPICPWCSHPDPEIIYHHPVSISAFEKIQMYAQCPNCGARGPVLNISPQHLNNEQVMNEYKYLSKRWWGQRKPPKIELKRE